MPNDAPRIGIVGASGAVGSEALSILADRGYPSDSIVCFGSDRSAGTTIEYEQTQLEIHTTQSIAEHRLDYAILCADAGVARLVEEQLRSTPTTIIDNSSAFRMDDSVPLVIPEINAHLISHDTRLIANPNCSTIMMLRALDPIRNALGIRSVIATTYQAVSGAGREGIQELHDQTRALLESQPHPTSIFPVSCAFNVFEHESPIDPETGFNGEETKMILESRKIWQSPDLAVLPSCVRVPVERAHAQSLVVDLETPTSEHEIRTILIHQGICVLEPGVLLTPHDATGSEDVIVGRIRIDPASASTRVLLWICCDQIRKGAALNAIQIMEHLISARTEVQL